MAAALGVGAAPGELVVSLGTSGTAFAVSVEPIIDETGEVEGFADATGRFLPLVCMLNCTRVVDSVSAMVGLLREDALGRAAAAPPGADGLLLMPYLAGERTPNLPQATGSITGLTAENATPTSWCGQRSMGWPRVWPTRSRYCRVWVSPRRRSRWSEGQPTPSLATGHRRCHRSARGRPRRR